MNTIHLTVDAIDKPQVLTNLGYSTKNPPGDQLLERLDAFIGQIPLDLMAGYASGPITKCDDEVLFTDSTSILSPAFCKIARKAKNVFFCLVTANSHVEELLYSSSDTMDALIIDALGSVIVEQGVEELRNKLATDSNHYISLPFSPGYCDYPLSEQEKIFRVLGDKPLGVSYHPDSFMMSPTKTISFIVAAGNASLEQNPCSVCQLDKCQMRRG